MITPNTIRPLLLGALSLASSLPAFAAPKDVPLLLSEDFESTPDGAIPEGYTKQGGVSVVSDVSHSGHKSLRMDRAINGPRVIKKSGPEITALGGTHWGRLYFKVELPVPEVPEKKTIHSTFVWGNAASPLDGDPIEVRVVGTQIRPPGLFQYLYNVQPRIRPERAKDPEAKARAEFATSTKFSYTYTDQWTLAEWFVDYATQTYHFYINGEEIKEVGFSKGAGVFEKSELPAVYDSFCFGFNNYQPAGEKGSGAGFVTWIDDIAFSKERIGAQGITKMETFTDPKQAQDAAVKRYPNLALTGSPLNKAFLSRVNELRKTKPEFFNNPSWPILVADEVAKTISPKP